MKSLLFGALMRVLSWITPRAAEIIAPPVAAAVWVLSPRRRRVTRVNLQAVYPDMDQEQRYRIARASLVHYVRGIFEAGILWHWPLARIVAHFDEPVGLEHMDRALAANKGVIIAAPHTGSWELLNLWVQLKYESTILFKPGNHPDFDAVLEEKRRRSGARMVPATRAGLRALYKLLKSGGVVGLLPDQEPTRGEGQFAPFFGIETMTGVLLPRIAQRTGARVVFVVCKRRPGGRYRTHFLPADKTIYDRDMRTALTAVNHGIEQVIEVDTTQYLWAYKRFRNRPEGAERIYGR